MASYTDLALFHLAQHLVHGAHVGLERLPLPSADPFTRSQDQPARRRARCPSCQAWRRRTPCRCRTGVRNMGTRTPPGCRRLTSRRSTSTLPLNLRTVTRRILSIWVSSSRGKVAYGNERVAILVVLDGELGALGARLLAVSVVYKKKIVGVQRPSVLLCGPMARTRLNAEGGKKGS